MDLIALILYGLVNVAMVLSHLRGKGLFYQFPFWAGAIALGWFFPQAVSGYLNIEGFPENAYIDGMVFATLCSAALWTGYSLALQRVPQRPSWLDARFDMNRLFMAGAVLCVFGFFFQWKLSSLPEEVLSETRWSGAAVKYLFFASVFKIGFLTLWLMYLSQPKLVVPRLLIFIIPCLTMLFSTAVLYGRRAEMMNLVAYLFVSLWFARRKSIPRWIIITGLVVGLVLINSIGTYRAIMKNKEASLTQRLTEAAQTDYLKEAEKKPKESSIEFKNYIFSRQLYAEQSLYDFGCSHWNKLVFNYVPAQIVGREVKDSLMLDYLGDKSPKQLVRELYGHRFMTGSTWTGYADAFGSFGWFGFIKFLAIGGIMGTLYRYGMYGGILGQLLYVYTLGTAMHAITHGTHQILFSVWVYFFALGYPALRWAQVKNISNQPRMQ